MLSLQQQCFDVSATLATRSLQFKPAMKSLSRLHIDNIIKIKNTPARHSDKSQLQTLREHECKEEASNLDDLMLECECFDNSVLNLVYIGMQS